MLPRDPNNGSTTEIIKPTFVTLRADDALSIPKTLYHPSNSYTDFGACGIAQLITHEIM
ncbi:hypothetical protein BDE02_17G133100 [Populus trichocarpa]|nr:hypothetical protein BDE02_17G133100 [Populus trichocarpa]